MPKFEYLDKLYKDYKSPFIDLLNKYYTEGGYKYKYSDSYKNKKDIRYQVYSRQINLDEYNRLKHKYLESLHKFKKGKLKDIDEDNKPLWWIRMYLDRIRREELDIRRDELKEKITTSESSIYDYKSTYSSGFLTYDKNKPLTPIIFFIISMGIGLTAVFLFIGLMSLIFD